MLRNIPIFFFAFILLPSIGSAASNTSLQHAKFKCVEAALPKPSLEESHASSDIYQCPKPPVDGQLSTLVNLKLYSEDDWTQKIAGQHYKEKVEAIYSAANEYDMSPIVLAGAMLQESSGADLGIGRDFDNWTCGPSQFSVLAWCEWAEVQDGATQKKYGWPSELVKQFQKKNPGVNFCAENKFLAREHLRPFLEIALGRMKNAIHSDKEYMMEPEYLLYPKPIEFAEVQSGLATISKAHSSADAGNPDAEMLRFQITKSFAENCSDHKVAFRVMAFTLRKIFETLPKELQEAQVVKTNELSNPLYAACKAQVTTRAYPLSVGWLLSDAIYNAGPSLMTGIADYQAKNNIPWDKFTPAQLLKAIQYAISPQFGMWGIGPKEAKDHIQGVLDTVGAK